MGEEMTREQGYALADLVVRIRPDWDRPGVIKFIRDALDKGTPEEVAVAAIRAAYDGAATTPGVIPHRVGVHPVTPPQKRENRATPKGRTCGICGLGQDECRARWHWDHAFETIDQTRQKRIAAADAYLPRPPRNLAAPYMDGKPVKDVELP